MPSINRTVLIIRVKDPFLQWVKQAEPAYLHNYTLEDLNHEPKIYLIPDTDTPDEVERWMSLNWQTIFEVELEGWCEDEVQWPQKRSYAMFKKWVGWEYSTDIEDTLHKPPVWEEETLE